MRETREQWLKNMGDALEADFALTAITARRLGAKPLVWFAAALAQVDERITNHTDKLCDCGECGAGAREVAFDRACQTMASVWNVAVAFNEGVIELIPMTDTERLEELKRTSYNKTAELEAKANDGTPPITTHPLPRTPSIDS